MSFKWIILIPLVLQVSNGTLIGGLFKDAKKIIEPVSDIVLRPLHEIAYHLHHHHSNVDFGSVEKNCNQGITNCLNGVNHVIKSCGQNKETSQKETINGIVKQLTPQINSFLDILKKTTATLLEQNSNLNQIISQEVSTSSKLLLQKVKTLDDLIQSIKNKNLGQQCTSCIKTEKSAVATINTSIIKQCSTSTTFGGKCQKLQKCQSDLEQIVPVCTTKCQTANEVKSCIQAQLVIVKNTLNNLQSNLSQTLKESKTSVQGCVTKSCANISLKLDRITKKVKQCESNN